MSERILKALMQLFAIIAKVELKEEFDTIVADEDSRNVVHTFLKQELNNKIAIEYLWLFDSMVESHHGKSKKKDGKRKRTSVNSVKVLRICTQINEELTQRQKVIVLIKILEFIFADKEFSEQEIEFASTVSETFNIPKEEFKSCLNFIESKASDVQESENYLVISNHTSDNYSLSKHIHSDGIESIIKIIQIKSVKTYFLKYYGKAELYLNGQLIPSNTVKIFNQGSSIRSSKVQAIYYSDVVSKFLSDVQSEKIVFSATDIKYKFKSGNIGIHNFSLCEESGKLIGIMGSSGSGKSTLMNILNGNYPPLEGSVKINGIDIYKNPKEIEGVIGFVPQDDLLIEELSVFQNLYYNSKLCFGNYNEDDIHKLVNDVLQSIGLYEARHLRVGSPLDKTISGGQRKRLNIALELIREPSVMFVDEPTSGLSSRDSENIMDLLKILALKGKLIFVVIHQPSSEIFKMFDKLVILDVGGFPIYNGNPIDAIIYFKKIVSHINADESECNTCGNVNPEQIFNIIDMKVVDEYGNLTQDRKVSAREWNDHYKKLNLIHKNDDYKSKIPKSIFEIPNKIRQASIFFIRDVKSKLTNTQYMLITLFEAPVLAGILAFFMKYLDYSNSDDTQYTFYNSENIPQFLFISVIVALFIGLTSSAEEIIGNLKILKRERFLNLSKGSYLFSKIIIMFLISAIQTLFYVVVGNLTLEIIGMNMAHWMILFSISCFANLLGLNISASFNSVKVIYILIPICIIPQLLFSGIIVSFDKLNPVFASKSHVPALGNVMASRWAYEALAVTQFKDNKFEQLFFKYDKQMSFANWKKDQWISNLQSKLKDVNRFVNDDIKSKDESQIIKNNRRINIIKNEITKELRSLKNTDCNDTEGLCDAINELENNNFTANTYTSINNLLSILKENYKAKYKLNERKKDSVIKLYIKPSDAYMKVINTLKRNKKISYKQHKKLRKFMEKLKDNSFQVFRNKYKNKALEDFVTNSNTLVFTDENNTNIIQKSDPIYLDPYDNNYFKSHFYAPSKKIFGFYIDTLYANIIVIWLMTILLIITLYFDMFKWLIDKISNIGSFNSKK